MDFLYVKLKLKKMDVFGDERYREFLKAWDNYRRERSRVYFVMENTKASSADKKLLEELYKEFPEFIKKP
jgi:hypothetical protein